MNIRTESKTKTTTQKGQNMVSIHHHQACNKNRQAATADTAKCAIEKARKTLTLFWWQRNSYVASKN